MAQFSKIRILLLVLTLLGGAVSLLLLFEHEQIAMGVKASLGICDLSSRFNCGSVIGSSWGSFLGVPLAAWGLFYYFFTAGLLLARLNTNLQRVALDATFSVLAAISIVFSIALFLISHFVIGALCPLCLSLYLINFLMLSLGLVQLRASGFRGALSEFKGLLQSKDFWNFREEAALGVFSVVSLVKLLVLSAILSFLVAVGLKLFVSQAGKTASKIELVEWPKSGRLGVVKTKSGVSSDLYKGARTAKIQIVEFADLRCPFCLEFYLELDELLKRYPGRLQVVFKNFPLDSSCNAYVPMPMHPEACQMAHGFRCLAEQDLFWTAMDILAGADFSKADDAQHATNISVLEQVIQQIDLDRQAWDECMDSGRYWEKIKEDISQANALGVNGTPAVWVNGRRFNGIRARGVSRLVKELLSKNEERR
jgi:protein-disulfide isomerase/uncharacterized membrane protein